MIFPSRSATSRHRSFSIKPVGPIVPVSWPPWPGSMTIRPIFSPSVRVKVDCPSRRGCGALAGRIKSGLASGADVLKDVDFRLFALGSVSRGLGVELAAALGRPKVPMLTLFELAPGHCSEAGPVSPPEIGRAHV